ENDEDNSVHFHVSSRHLTLASKYFERVLLTGAWSESRRSEEDGYLHLNVGEPWDAEAFLVILNAFHLKNKQLPRVLELEMLAKVAQLADYYECKESLEVWTTMWIINLKSRAPIPPTYCRELIMWLCIAWVFDEEVQFQRVFAVAAEKSMGAIQTLMLPIPDRERTTLLTITTDAIDSIRCQAIELVIERVHSLLQKYRSTNYVCGYNVNASFECSSFLLGALMKHLDKHALLSPRPQAPFTGLSLHSVCAKVETMESPGW
ncbi:hypothetical protein GQ44DRAFT_584495, partial [Phaeosphaeriaceae sp. PMI808]